jgi:hypothetical protein
MDSERSAVGPWALGWESTWQHWAQAGIEGALVLLAIAIVVWTVVVRLQDERALRLRYETHVQRLLDMLAHIRTLLAARSPRV